MPRNGSGVSSVVNTFVIDTVADPDEVNANFTDVADQLTNSLPRDGQAGMNAPLPLQNGTAALPALTFSSDPDTGIYRSAANELSASVGGNQRLVVNSGGSYIPKSSDIASAATTDLSTATGDYVNITGTTTITAFGTSPAGTERTLRFTGALTLTHNATSLILPGGANITTVAGDVARFRSEGSGNWRCVSYMLSAAPVTYGLILLQSIDLTGAASTAGAFLNLSASSYDQYELRIVNAIPATTGADIYLENSTNNGSSYGASATVNWYRNQQATNSGTPTNPQATLDTKIILANNITNSALVNGLKSNVTLFPAASGTWGAIFSLLAHTGAIDYGGAGGGDFPASTNAIRVRPSTGNWTSGRLNLYGLRH